MTVQKENDTLIIIPAFNEELSIEKVISDLKKDFKNADILVINDGSRDKTGELAQKKGVILLTHIFNMGIGASFQTGCMFASLHNYKYIIRMDADGQHGVGSIKDILNPIIRDEADIAIGSRFLRRTEANTSFFRLMGIFVLSKFLSLITGNRITDPTSGFCAMNKKAYSFFSDTCPEDYPEPEITIHHDRFRIVEIPITMQKRNAGISSITPLKSLYYMIKVFLAVTVRYARKERK